MSNIRQVNPILQHFTYEHLPPALQAVSAPICALARAMDDELPDGPEKSVGLRKLLEAKDAFVRQKLEQIAGTPPSYRPPQPGTSDNEQDRVKHGK